MNEIKKNELWIEEHDLALYESKLSLDDNQVSVVGYLRVSTRDEGSENSLMMQAQLIRDLCSQEFPEGCRIFWVADHGASGNQPYWSRGLEPGGYRTGLTVLTQLIERGLVQHVCLQPVSLGTVTQTNL